MKCPTCGLGTSPVECDNCGDVRCNSTGHGSNQHGCSTNEGPFGKSGAGGNAGMPCKACGNGRYQRL